MIGSGLSGTPTIIVLLPSFIVSRCLLQVPLILAMATGSQQPGGQGSALSPLDEAIRDLNLAREAMRVTPVKAALDSASILLETLRVGPFPPVTDIDQSLTLRAGVEGRQTRLCQTRIILCQRL